MAEKKMADMHIHSTASDGRLTPEELIRMAEKIPHLAAIAVTDHDTPEGGRRALHYGSSIIKKTDEVKRLVQVSVPSRGHGSSIKIALIPKLDQ